MWRYGSSPGLGGNKVISIGLVFSLVLMGILGIITFESEVVSGSTIYVGSGVGNHTASINDAIANYAIPGDTVFVHSGLYTENIFINKTIDLIGEDRNTTIIDGMELRTIVLSSVGWVNITGFTIINGSTGIWESSCSNGTFENNIIRGNNISVHIEQQTVNSKFLNCSLSNALINVNISGQSNRNKFINCTLTNATLNDFHLTDESNANLLNTTFNKSAVYYGDTLSILTVEWFMHVNVIYYDGNPVPGASLWINDTTDSNLFTGSVDSRGWFRWFIVTEYVEQDIDGDIIGNRVYFTPHHLAGNDGDLWGYSDPNMNISKVVLIVLGIPPPIPPPTNLTTRTVSNGNFIELEWNPPFFFALDHYLIYRADSAKEFDFSTPYNISTLWPDPKASTWIDPDPNVTSVDDDFYYIIRAANANESDISSTSNTAGVWTRTFNPGKSTFSLPLEPYEPIDVELYCQGMDASYIKWRNPVTQFWVRHLKGDLGNNSNLNVGEGYEVGFMERTTPTRYTFCGMPAGMIRYDEGSFSGFNYATEARTLGATVNPATGHVTLHWDRPMAMTVGDNYKIYRATTRDGFFDGSAVNIGFLPYGTEFWVDFGAANPGTQFYYMIIPERTPGEEGAGTYSIGIWTKDFSAGYDSFGIPLKTKNTFPVYWYSENIFNCDGINYFNESENRWIWHSSRMSSWVYDPLVEMGLGYQISTSGPTKFTFIGT